MPSGPTPSATVTNVLTRSVKVTWPAVVLPSGAPVGGYVVRRRNVVTPGSNETVLAACAGVVAALTCTETGVPVGTWQYTVQPALGSSWRGAESAASTSVVVL